MNDMKADAKEMAREVMGRASYKLPFDITAMVQDHGISIIRRDIERSVTGVLVLDSTRVTMLLNRLFDASQQRFSLAHLFGHFVLHKNLSPLFVELIRPEESRSHQPWALLEQEADEFAAEMLMPEEILRDCVTAKPHHFRSPSVVQPLAARFGVSELAFALRLSQLGLMNS